jgi:hypothetical protein
LAPIAACLGGAPAYGTPWALFTPLPPILQAKGWRRSVDGGGRYRTNKTNTRRVAMEELLQLVRQAVREELSKGKQSPKAEFVELGKFSTGQNTQIRVSVSMGTDGRPILGLAKMHGTYIEQQFGFRLTEELAGALVNLINQHYPQLTAKPTKKGRGA